MSEIYFEVNGVSLLDRVGMRKSEFARRMGIRKQNVNALFKTKNIETIRKASEVLNVPFELLIGYVEEPEWVDLPIPVKAKEYIISEDDIPTGDSVEDRRARHKIILEFYHAWKERNPEAKRYNLSLHEDINIRYVSIEETAGQASLSYLSTLAVLQLDAILTNALLVETTPANHKKKNQKGFQNMLRMSYVSPGVGVVKMMVGVRKGDKSKIQYCITAIDADKIIQEAK